MEAVCQYPNLRLETERSIQDLANEIWLQQAEISKNRESDLQENLNMLVKRNRELLEENGQLLRRNEKLSAKASSPRMTEGCYVADSLTKNNEQLQIKFNTAMKQVAELEKQLENHRRHKQTLEEKLRNMDSEIASYKATVKRNEAAAELEMASVQQQLQTSMELIKSGIDAGNILLKDLNACTRKLKTTSLDSILSEYKVNFYSIHN